MHFGFIFLRPNFALECLGQISFEMKRNLVPVLYNGRKERVVQCIWLAKRNMKSPSIPIEEANLTPIWALGTSFSITPEYSKLREEVGGRLSHIWQSLAITYYHLRKMPRRDGPRQRDLENFPCLSNIIGGATLSFYKQKRMYHDSVSHVFGKDEQMLYILSSTI